MKQENYGNIGAVLGVVLGSLAWAVLAGFAVKEPIVSVLAAVLAVVLVAGALRFLSAYPARRLFVFGAIILVVIVADILLINRLYQKIPPSFCGVTTGKECASLCSLNWLLVVFAAIGFALVIVDIVFMRKKR